MHSERLAQIAVTQESIASLELLRLQVRFEGEPLPETGNRMEVMVDHKRKRVRFGPVDGVQIVPAQRGLATFMLAQLIHWCQRYCGDYAVTPIALHNSDSANEDARSARDAILSRAGFTITPIEGEPGAALAQANRVNDLIGSWNTERIQPLQINTLLAQLRETEALNQKQEGRIKPAAGRHRQLQTLRLEQPLCHRLSDRLLDLSGVDAAVGRTALSQTPGTLTGSRQTVTGNDGTALHSAQTHRAHRAGT